MACSRFSTNCSFCQLLDDLTRLDPSTSGLCMQTLECQSLLSSEIWERVVMLPSISQFRSNLSVRSLLRIHVKTARFPLSFVISMPMICSSSETCLMTVCRKQVQLCRRQCQCTQPPTCASQCIIIDFVRRHS